MTQIIQIEHEDEFEERALGCRGQSRVYFSRDENDLTESNKIDGCELYVETNLSANNSFDFARKVALSFGYPSKDFQVQLSNSKEA